MQRKSEEFRGILKAGIKPNEHIGFTKRRGVLYHIGSHYTMMQI
jgi:hypothetical protein